MEEEAEMYLVDNVCLQVAVILDVYNIPPVMQSNLLFPWLDMKQSEEEVGFEYMFATGFAPT